MSRIKLSDEQEAWLADQHSKLTHKELAAELGCCVDTLKRMLMRRNLQYFPGAKYQFREPPKTWKRPCQTCGCTKTRPKYQYRCNSCHEREEEHPDFFNEAAYSIDVSTTKLSNPNFYSDVVGDRWYAALAHTFTAFHHPTIHVRYSVRNQWKEENNGQSTES